MTIPKDPAYNPVLPFPPLQPIPPYCGVTSLRIA